MRLAETPCSAIKHNSEASQTIGQPIDEGLDFYGSPPGLPATTTGGIIAKQMLA